MRENATSSGGHATLHVVAVVVVVDVVAVVLSGLMPSDATLQKTFDALYNLQPAGSSAGCVYAW